MHLTHDSGLGTHTRSRNDEDRQQQSCNHHARHIGSPCEQSSVEVPILDMNTVSTVHNGTKGQQSTIVVALTSIFCALALALLIQSLGRRGANDDVDELSQPDARHEDDIQSNDSTPPRFPWEPAEGTVSRAALLSSKPRHMADQCKELDFLATMTFANGGIRSPSCPCCI